MINSKRMVRLVSRLFLVSFVFMISLSSVGCSAKYENKIAGMSLSHSTQIMNLLSRSIRVEMEKMETYATEIAFSDLLQSSMSGYKNLGMLEKLDFVNKLNRTLSVKFSVNPYISAVQIITNTGDVISSSGNSGWDNEYKDHLIKSANSKKGSSIWSLSKNKNIVLSKAIIDVKSGQSTAIIAIELKDTFLTSIYKDIEVGADSNIFLIDRKGIVISSTKPEIEIGKEYKNMLLLSKVFEDKLGSERGFIVSINQEKYIVSFAELTGHDWYIICTIPYKYITDLG